MKTLIPRRVRRLMATAAIALCTLAMGGCGSPQQVVKGLVDTGFQVTRHVVVGGAELSMKATELSLKTAESAGKGTLNAVMK